MNDKQQKAIVIALVVIGCVLAYSMMVVDNEPRGTYANTFILSWATQPYFGEPVAISYAGGPPAGWQRYYPAGRAYLYVTRGIPGIFLGLIAPLALWAAAIYITLGSKKIGANT